MSNLTTKPEQIRLQEEDEVQAILGHPPTWLTRWGISLVFASIIILVILAGVFRYPDVVEAPAKIQTEYPPVRMEAKVDGRVQELPVNSGEQVTAGALLAVMQSPVSRDDVSLLQQQITHLIPLIEQQSIRDFQLPTNLQLADLQPAYSKLTALLESQKYALRQDDTRRKIALYREQIQEMTKLDAVSEKEINTLQEEVTIAQEKLERYQKAQSGVLSPLEMEAARIEYLRAQRALESKERDRIQTRLDKHKLQAGIIELTQQESDDIKAGWVALIEAARELQGVLERWTDTYLIRAPVAGKILLSKLWHENQSVSRGETVLTIAPQEGRQKIIARAELPMARSGKVEVGDTALLRLAAYPYKEYGVVKGRVREIAALPEAAGPDQSPVYFARIDLTEEEFKTTYPNPPKPVAFTQEMRATARIITADRSLLERIMNDLLGVFREN